MTALVDLGEFLPGYLVEADELLGTATRNLTAVDAAEREGRSNPRALREVFRAVHTIKGLSAMVGVEPIVGITHELEVLLREADQASGTLGVDAIDVASRGLAAVEQRVRALAKGEAVGDAPAALLGALSMACGPRAPGAAAALPAGLSSDLADKLTPSERNQLAPQGDERPVQLEFVPSPARAAQGSTITSVRERLAAVGDIVKILPTSRPTSDEVPGGLVFTILMVTEASSARLLEACGEDVAVISAAPAPAEADAPDFDDTLAAASAGSRHVVRVDVARLDDTLDKLGALVVSRFRLERAVAALAVTGVDVRTIAAALQDNARQLRDLRSAIMQVRLVSAAEMLERVPLLVRRLATDTGKAVKLSLETGRAELDKAVAERIFPAIVHVIRNAIDHGIENAEARRRAGKSPEAQITITCFTRGHNQIEMTVEDDGAGIDAEALARRAGREMPRTPEALLALMATPGLSSREAATTTSGRGLGMDIVKQVVVDELGGELALETTRGHGTKLSLRIPLTLTIVDAFSFRCGAQHFVAPVAGIEEIIDVAPQDVTRIPSGKGRADMRMIDRRGFTMPLISLQRVFRLPPSEAALRKAMVVRRGAQPLAFEVDKMLGQQEVVVRPLEDPLVKTPGVVGSTDLGDGLPTLVLDLLSLGGILSRRRSDAPS